MPFVIQFQSRKYTEYEKQFLTKALYTTVGNILLQSGQRNGKMYVFPGKFLFYSVDAKPNIEVEIFGDNIRYIQLLDDLDLAIILESDDLLKSKFALDLLKLGLLMDNIKREVWLQKSVGLE